MPGSVIVDYQDFTPIAEAFERLGYRVFRSKEELTAEELAECELALFCMFKSIKQPLRSRKVTQQLNDAITGTANKVNVIQTLSLNLDDLPTAGQLQATLDKLNEFIVGLVQGSGRPVNWPADGR